MCPSALAIATVIFVAGQFNHLSHSRPYDTIFSVRKELDVDNLHMENDKLQYNEKVHLK